MRRIIIKYTILLIVTFVLVRIIAGIIILSYPNQLSFNGFSVGIDSLKIGLAYIFNIGITFILHSDMKKQNTVSYSILLLNILASYIGILFYLILNYKPILKSNSL